MSVVVTQNIIIIHTWLKAFSSLLPHFSLPFPSYCVFLSSKHSLSLPILSFLPHSPLSSIPLSLFIIPDTFFFRHNLWSNNFLVYFLFLFPLPPSHSFPLSFAPTPPFFCIYANFSSLLLYFFFSSSQRFVCFYFSLCLCDLVFSSFLFSLEKCTGENKGEKRKLRHLPLGVDAERISEKKKNDK